MTDPASEAQQRVTRLAGALAGLIDPDELAEALRRSASAGEPLQATLLGLGLLLAERSVKAATEYLRQAPLLIDHLGAEEWAPWVGLGMTMAGRSATMTVRYFRESPAILADVNNPAARLAILASAQRFAEWEPGLALECVRQAPAVIRLFPDQTIVSPVELLQPWVACGDALARQDPILASEYFKHSPRLLAHAPAALAEWAALGGTLVQPNQLGKPDYLPALEYFRLTPDWLGALTPPDLRVSLVELGRLLADEPPESRVGLFRQALGWLEAVPGDEFRRWTVRSAIRLALIAPRVALAFLERSGELFRRWEARSSSGRGSIEHSDPAQWHRPLDEWIDHGINLLSKSPEAAIAYFRLESSAGQDYLDGLAGGLSLPRVARTLTLFAEGLSGHAVTIAPITESSTQSGEHLPAALPYRSGSTIHLPPFVSAFGSEAENFRYYKVMTAHQAAQLEFGAFEVGEDARDAFFRSFAHPLLADDLWKIAEGGRIDAQLRRAYPGLRRDLDLVVGYTLYQRPSIGVSVEEMGGPSNLSPIERVVELLLQLSMAGRTKEPIPGGLEPLIFDAGRLLQRVQQPAATAADSLAVARDVYTLLIERLTGAFDQLPSEPSTLTPGANPVGEAGLAQSALSAGGYREVASPQYRGQRPEERSPASASTGEPMAKIAPAEAARDGALAGGVTDREVTASGAPSPALGSAGVVDGETSELLPGVPDTFSYPEWDELAQDYRPGWCTVRERAIDQTAGGEAATFRDQVLTQYRGQLLLLRRAFERLRPDRFKKLKRQEAGEEIDLEAAIEAVVDRRAGRTPSTKLYQQRDRRERDVAVAFLVDVSGSTGRQLPELPDLLHGGRSAGQSVIQVEKEGLLLLAEAVSAVGDAFALYGYSGDSRDRVDFYLVKEFDEPYSGQIGERIGGMSALAQNRDGAAIRHATRKLMQREAHTRLLILLSDGRPFDQGYEGAHALADTRMALMEAHRQRIRTFCITVDRQAEDYLDALFAPSRYTVIDHVRRLPERLPWIYQRVTT